MLLGREQILRLLPHAGSMCLLDEVISVDSATIHCRSRRYCQPDNPMRRVDGTLGAATGVEIAAQAMALQAALSTGKTAQENTGPTPHGYLVGLRDLLLHSRLLDSGAQDLDIRAERLMGDSKGATYRFTLGTADAELLSGRAVLMLASPR